MAVQQAMTEIPNDAAPAASAPPVSPPYTAVVYFHGIGQQRHYEQMCRVAQRLDEYVFARSTAGDAAFDRLRLARSEARSEPHREGSEHEDVSYLRTNLRDQTGHGAPVHVRFYEAYWAPEAADAPGALQVALWLARQIKTPLRILLSPWRRFERLRRADLIAMVHRRRNAGAENADQDQKRLVRLVRLYSDFHRRSAHHEYERGTFGEFREFVRKEEGDDLLGLLDDWRHDHRRNELTNLLSVFSLLVGVVSGAGLLAMASFWLLSWLARSPLFGGSAPWIDVSFSSVTSLMAGFLAAVGATRFLREYAGDVQQFVTYEEAELLYQRRKAIVGTAVRHLRHVMADDRCERIVLVSHSLGTAVAVDTLLELHRFNKARTPSNPMSGPLPISKVSHLVTMGSPIDKINYFFGVLSSEFRVYEAMVDAMRGDLGSPPFSKTGRQPWIHWINYWDGGDLISGPIETLAPDILRSQEVDNVRVASYALPSPMAAHDGYFHHAEVIDALFRVIFLNEYSYARAHEEADALRKTPDDPVRPDYDRQRLGPGSGSRLQSALFWLLPAVPWLMLVALIEILFELPPVAQWTLAAAVATLAIAEWRQGRGHWHCKPWNRRTGTG